MDEREKEEEKVGECIMMSSWLVSLSENTRSHTNTHSPMSTNTCYFSLHFYETHSFSIVTQFPSWIPVKRARKGESCLYILLQASSLSHQIM